jgi:hypothetical protein
MHGGVDASKNFPEKFWQNVAFSRHNGYELTLDFDRLWHELQIEM